MLECTVKYEKIWAWTYFRCWHAFVHWKRYGGVPYILESYSKVNNKYLKSYDLKQESKLIMYLDASNLYGCAMYKLLSGGRFK